MRQKFLISATILILFVFMAVAGITYMTGYSRINANIDETLVQFSDVSAQLAENQIDVTENRIEKLVGGLSSIIDDTDSVDLAISEDVKVSIDALISRGVGWTLIIVDADGKKRNVLSGSIRDIPWGLLDEILSEGGGSRGVRIPDRPDEVGLLLVFKIPVSPGIAPKYLVAQIEAQKIFAPVMAPIQRNFKGDLFLLDNKGRTLFFLNNGRYLLPEGATRTVLRGMSQDVNTSGPMLSCHDLENEPSRVAARVLVGFGLEKYILGAAFPLERYIADRSRLINGLLLTLALGLGISLALSYPFAGSLTKPIRKLVEAVRAFKREEITEYIPMDSRDEIGELSRAFFEMAEEVARSHEELREANLNLEQRVADQTRRLSEALTDLVGKNQAVEMAHSNIEAVLHSIRDGVLVTDKEQVIVRFNLPGARILNLNPAAVGKHVAEVVRIEPVVDLILGHNLEEVDFKSPVPVKFTIGGGENEKQRAIMAQTYPYRTAEGVHLGLVTILRDITAEEEIEKIKEEFLAKISHELRTPMTSIKGFTELLLAGAVGELNEDQTDFLNDIQEEAERLERLINNLLDLSKLEAGKMKFNKENLILNVLVNKTVSLMRPQIEAKKIDVSLELEDRLELRADPDRIMQVLINLMSNAVKFTPQGGSIVIKAQKQASGELRISVSDSGEGIPVEMQERVFDKFEQGPSFEAAQRGTGLGLPICREIIEAHGGRIWVESVFGQGAAFIFELPISIREEVLEEDLTASGSLS